MDPRSRLACIAVVALLAISQYRVAARLIRPARRLVVPRGAVFGGVSGAALTGGSIAGTLGGAAVGDVIRNQIGRDLQRGC